jgi:hypothetical protein
MFGIFYEFRDCYVRDVYIGAMAVCRVRVRLRKNFWRVGKGQSGK